jgi:3-methyladenine DNA glycosylase AlkC
VCEIVAMADALKTFFSPALVRRLADDLVRASPGFPSRAFIRQASAGLDELELVDRAKHIATALRAQLPADYEEAIEIVLRSLGPEHEADELLGIGMAPFFYMPYLCFVAEHGLDHFDLSLRAQYELTKRFSAEFSIRAYIAKDPARTFASLRTWATDPNPHVRRLVSEGTRLRLPWGTRVAWLDQHPERVIELLSVLKDDPTTLVRRSVANNLNDLSKVHRELTLRTCETWLDGRRALVEHALRSAVKRGDAGAIRLLGFGGKPAVAIERVRFAPKRVAIGDRVSIAFDLRSTSRSSQELLVDLVVHFVKATGRASPKTFKLKRLALGAGDTAALESSISLAVHTTRKPQPGKHAVDVLINGQPRRVGEFVVVR